MESTKRFDKDFIWRLFVPILLGVLIWFFPWAPESVPKEGWEMFAIFLSTIVAIMLKPLPMGAIAFIGLTFTMVVGTLDTDTALSGFSNSTAWLIVSAFFIARAISKSGLGSRIAYIVIERFGKTTLGLTYSIFIADLIIGPAIPSSTARAGAILTPVTKSIAESYGSNVGDGTENKIGAYLMHAIYHGDTIVATMFLTAGASKPLAQELAHALDLGVNITWGNWFLGALVPGIISLLLIPPLLMKITKPEITETPEAPEWAHEQKEKLGKMSFDEKLTGIVFISAIILWATGDFHSLGSQTVAFLAVSVLLLGKVLDWSDITEYKGAWNVLIWFGVLVMMAGQLNELGFIPWLSEAVARSLSGFSWQVVLLLLALIFFYSHYFFASLTAHVTAMYPAFLAVAIAAGAPPTFAALLLGYVTQIVGSTTHYASGPASIIFGQGYISQSEWWRVCFLMGIFYLIVWLGVGGGWMYLIGIH